VVGGATILEFRAFQLAAAQLQAHLEFERSGGMLGRPTAAAAPDLGQRIRQHNRRTVLDIHRCEAVENRDRDRLGGDDVRDGAVENFLDASSGSRGKALVEGLGRNVDAQGSGGLRQFLQGGRRIGQKAKDQGLDEGGTSEGRGTLNEAGGASGLLGDGRQHVLHRGRDLWYSRHGEAPREYDVVQNLYHATEASLFHALA
jgi:hypothetical protein